MIPQAFLWALLPFVLAWLNRVRGGGLGGQYLPGRALYWAAPAVGLAAWTVAPWSVALAVAIGYLVWGVPGWGWCFDLGRMPDEWNRDDLDPLGRAIDGLAFPDHVALFLRHLLVVAAVVPLAWLVSWWLLLAIPVFAGLVVLAYEIAWRLWPRDPIQPAELATGALWGLLVLAAVQ